MNLQRIIPVLLVDRGRLIKTIKFAGETYIGDPINTVRIFNEKCADEIIVLDIGAAKRGTKPDVEMLGRLASECFMPLCYGGGITSYDDAARLFALGVEKVSVNTGLRAGCIRPIAESFGSQAVVYSLDVRRRRDGALWAFGKSGTVELGPALDCAREAVDQGAGEIVLHMIDGDGTLAGYDLEAVHEIAEVVPIPLVACGGARDWNDFTAALRAGASAVAAGSLFVFIGRLRAVLISYPTEEERKCVQP